jgi:hypothetical protein
VASEAVEDLHYFKFSDESEEEHPHDTESLLKERLDIRQEHDHGDDLPSRLLKILFYPLFFLAALWNVLFSRESGRFSSWSAFTTAFKKAWNRETGTPAQVSVDLSQSDACTGCDCDQSTDKPAEVPAPKLDFTKKSSTYKTIEKLPVRSLPLELAARRVQCYIQKNAKTPAEEQEKLTELHETILKQSDDAYVGGPNNVQDVMSRNADFRDRLFSPKTREFLEAMPSRVMMFG